MNTKSSNRVSIEWNLDLSRIYNRLSTSDQKKILDQICNQILSFGDLEGIVSIVPEED